MQFFKILVQLSFFVFVFLSCTGDGGAAVQEAALKICDCTQPVVAINEKMESSKREGNIQELTAMMEKAGKAFEDLVDCAEDHSTEDMKREHLQNALVKNCKINVRLARDVVEKLPLSSD
ncbi:MAG: hypothetical protein AAF573_04415 [Bacteroidota bacterium]